MLNAHFLRRALLAFALTTMALSLAYAQRRMIDEELLSGLVQAKQEQVKARALTNVIRENAATLNMTTYNTLYDMIDILLTEKNKTVMTRGLVGKMADYALAQAATRYLMKYDDVLGAGLRTKGLSASNVTEELKKIYDDAQKKGHSLRIAAKTSEEIGRDNWLLDHMYMALSEGKNLRQRGFFKSESRREWAYDTTSYNLNYEKFWNGRELERAKLWAKVQERAKELNENFGSVDAVARALVDQDWKALRTLDLNKLAVGVGSGPNEPVRAVVQLFIASLDLYRRHVGQNALLARMADVIADHVIFEPEVKDNKATYGFSIDVEGVILSLEDNFLSTSTSPTKRSWFNLRPFFTIGLNYGYFSKLDSTLQAEEAQLGLQQIAWAGEKLGFKWFLWDWKYTRGQQAGEPFRFHGRICTRKTRPRDPIVSNLYVSLYGSGLLYTIADLRSEREFRYPIVGLGTGVRFFNGLELNASYAAPVVPGTQFAQMIDGGFLNIGLDIPLLEYIREARAKRGK